MILPKTEKILITGGSGFIGTNAVEYFSNKGFEVLNIDIKPPQNRNHLRYWIQCDILDLYKYREFVVKFSPDYFIHLAARTDLKETSNIKGYSANIDGVENTIEVSNSCNSLKRIIFASSRMVCSIDYVPKDEFDYCPPNLYGESKKLGENIIRKSNVNAQWIIVRPTSIWGPWFDVPYNIFFATIQKKLYFNPGNFNPFKSFGFVGNTVYQLYKIFQAHANLIDKRTYYLCDYPPLKLKNWAELIRKEMGLKPIFTCPYSLLKLAASIGDVLYKLRWYKVPIQSFRLNNLITNMVHDTKELEELCGDLPYSLEQGVKQTVMWLIN